MSWHCIPVAVIACGAFVITPIPHTKAFIGRHPVPACERVVRCHMVWEPDTLPAGFVPGRMLYLPHPIPTDYPAPPPEPPLYGHWEQPQPGAPVDVPEPSGALALAFGVAALWWVKQQETAA